MHCRLRQAIAQTVFGQLLLVGYAGHREITAYLVNLLSNLLVYFLIVGIGDDFDDKGGYLFHLFLPETPAGYCRCAQPDAAGDLRRVRVEGN